MARVFSGMPADDLGAVAWVKSGRSNSTGNCVELARVDGESRLGLVEKGTGVTNATGMFGEPRTMTSGW